LVFSYKQQGQLSCEKLPETDEMVDVVTQDAGLVMVGSLYSVNRKLYMTFYGVEIKNHTYFLLLMFVLNHKQLTDATTPSNVEMVNVVTEVAGQVKGKNQMVDPEDDLLYDPIKSVTKKKEIWRLGVILDDMWTIFKGDTEDHIELLVRDAKVMESYPAFHPYLFDAFHF
jgi:uncharacterized protein YunC (DUF1805 family)